jgi:enoyl-CoA hydratase/carnithine racemase
VVFTAEGEGFCAGNDVSDFVSGLGDDPPAVRFIEKLVRMEKPMVAAVHGPAVGIGATLLLHCDLVYASETARLLTPFVSLGLVPEAGSSLLLPRRVGYAVAAEMVLLGVPIDAQRARDLGLVNAIIPAGELRAHALLQARALAQKPPSALRLSRQLLRGNLDETLARMREETAIFGACLASGEAQEAFSAFMERRRPDFSKFA